MTIASDLLQQHIQTLVENNAHWQTLIADDILWELPYADAIGHPVRLSGREEVVRRLSWFLGAVENFSFFDVNENALHVLEGELTGYTKAAMAQDIHALARKLGYERIRIVGHDIGLMVAYAHAAQYPSEVDRIALMDAFLPGVGNWRDVWLMRDLWHFHFYGKTPLALVHGRERIYFEHFWNDFAADSTHSVPERDRRIYAKAYARPGGMRSGFEYFRAFEQDAKDFARFAQTPLRMPMLVLTGEKASGDFLIQQGRLVATNVEGVVVRNSGHWLMEEAPDQVIPQLVEFLNR